MIEIDSLSFSYGQREILKDVSFSAQNGEIVGILGNNGVGKSTLITCINKIRKPTSGRVLIDGVSTDEMNRNELARSISYVAQKSEATQISVFDSILLGRKPYMKWGASQEDLEMVEDVIKSLGLEGFAVRNLDELSGGEMQKVLIARALVQEPKVMLLDEPTSNLDPRNQYAMMKLVRQMAKERDMTVLVILHDLNLALSSCDKVFFMKEGVGKYYCHVNEVTEGMIDSVYGIQAKMINDEGQRYVLIKEDV